MKKERITVMGFCFFLALSIFIQGTAGQDRSRIVDGITVITNGKKPRAPAGAAVKLVLEEIYVVGRDDSPDASFAGRVDLDVHKDGSIFVLDSKDNRVKVFDAAGRFLRAFGKKGQGPGELNQPAGILFSPEGDVIVEDPMNHRLAVFTPDGTFVRHVSTAKFYGLGGIQAINPDLIIARSMGIGEGGKPSMNVTIYDRDLNPKVKLASAEFANPGQAKFDPFTMMIAYELDGRGNIFLNSPGGYEIRVVSPEGKTLRTFGRDFDPVPITKSDQEEMLKLVSNTPGVNVKELVIFPPAYPPYTGFIPADEGRLLVQTYEKDKEKKGRYSDVFDDQGRYIARVLFEDDLRLWRDGRAYFSAEDKDGDIILKCFRARWEK